MSAASGSTKSHDVKSCKADVRKVLRGSLKMLSDEAMSSQSQAISTHILQSPLLTGAATVGIYIHCAKLREVDTSSIVAPLLAAGKRVYVPVVEDKSSNMKLLHLDDMASLTPVPPFGILEPPPVYRDGSPRDVGTELDVLVMPGLGFDRTGRRLGRGGGYYDKLLMRLQERAAGSGRAPPLTVALAYDVQLLPEVPVDAHDMPVDVLVSANQALGCTERGRACLAA